MKRHSAQLEQTIRERDADACVICGRRPTGLHFILDPALWPDETGLQADNAVLLCPTCREKAVRGTSGGVCPSLLFILIRLLVLTGHSKMLFYRSLTPLVLKLLDLGQKFPAKVTYAILIQGEQPHHCRQQAWFKIRPHKPR